jgi:hypothetical protein
MKFTNPVCKKQINKQVKRAWNKIHEKERRWKDNRGEKEGILQWEWCTTITQHWEGGITRSSFFAFIGSQGGYATIHARR